MDRHGKEDPAWTCEPHVTRCSQSIKSHRTLILLLLIDPKSSYLPVVVPGSDRVDDLLEVLRLLDGHLGPVGGLSEHRWVQVTIYCHCEDLDGRPGRGISVSRLDANLKKGVNI